MKVSKPKKSKKTDIFDPDYVGPGEYYNLTVNGVKIKDWIPLGDLVFIYDQMIAESNGW